MKKIAVLISIVMCQLVSFADYTGVVTTSQSDLSFSTKSGYDVVSLPDGQYTHVIGAPQLPVKTLNFIIPIDKMVSSIVINSTTVQQLSGTYNIFPVQTPVLTSMSMNSSPFDDPNPLIYNSTNPYPGISDEITNDGYPMGYHVVTITFYPVQYIPSSQILNLYTTIDFTIVYANNSENILIPNMQSKYSNDLSRGCIQSMVVNPSDINSVTGGARQVVGNGSLSHNIKGMNPTGLINIPDYIIITSNALIGTSTAGFQKLADWKTQKGINTLIVRTEDIYSNYLGYDNAEKIRNYLKDVYVNFGSSYILIGGDVDIVPTRFTPLFGGNFETNYYYATVQGNWNSNGNNIFGESGELTTPEMSSVFFVGRSACT